MDDQRWSRIEHLYHEALKLDASDRRTWLSTMCGADVSLRDEVEILLKYDSAAGGFLEGSALQLAARTLAGDKARRIEGRRIGGYDIGEHIGVGGMADVYRAKDARLGRAVALKIFDNVISAAALRRFEAEARAASLLNHPNIVTIYGLGEEDDIAYIAMELVEGSTLRERLSDTPFTLERTVGIAVQLADAIAAAHARGIVHRDLKPENVMISPEWRVKVLDFGIATLEHEVRAASETGADGARGKPAADGAQCGTAAYMAPEQVLGGPVGPAADQFAFGVIAYEMLAGHRPFAGNTRDETLQAIVHQAPAPIDSLGGKAEALASVIWRCLAKDPAKRYADSTELAAELRRIGDDLRVAAGGGGMTRRQMVSLSVAGVVGATAGPVGFQLWSRQTAGRTLAVLPFANPKRDEMTEYLCDGITETLIRRLAVLPSVRIIARATAFTFKGSTIDPRAVGRQLEVDATLWGSVTRRSGRVLVSAELIDSSGRRLWGHEFDRPAGDVLAVQDAIVAAIISDGFHLELTADQRRRVLRALTADPWAYDLFLQGLHHFRLDTEDDYLEARALLTQATDRDRDFALAYVSLASTHSVMAIDGYAAPAETWPAAELHIQRAMAVDPDLPDAHAEAAIAACFYRWDVADASRHWKVAQNSPRGEMQSELLTAYALQEWASGRPAAALELARTARQIDPLSTQAAIREADLLAAVGRFPESVTIYDTLIRHAPTDARAYFGLAEVRASQRQFDAALSVRRKAHATIGDESLDPVFARARGEAGWDAVVRVHARRELDMLRLRQETGGFVSILDIGRLHSQLGDTTEALAHLEAAFDERAAGLVLLAVDPAWNSVRQEPRFVAAVRRVGIHQPT